MIFSDYLLHSRNVHTVREHYSILEQESTRSQLFPATLSAYRAYPRKPFYEVHCDNSSRALVPRRQFLGTLITMTTALCGVRYLIPASFGPFLPDIVKHFYIIFDYIGSSPPVNLAKVYPPALYYRLNGASLLVRCRT